MTPLKARIAHLVKNAKDHEDFDYDEYFWLADQLSRAVELLERVQVFLYTNGENVDDIAAFLRGGE